MKDQQRATVLTPSAIRHLLRVTEATSRHPERDAAILLLGLSCGMRCTETAQITIADLMFPSGKLRQEVSLRAAITKGCKQRCVYLASPKLIEALERYLSFRVDHRIQAGERSQRGSMRKPPIWMLSSSFSAMTLRTARCATSSVISAFSGRRSRTLFRRLGLVDERPQPFHAIQVDLRPLARLKTYGPLHKPFFRRQWRSAHLFLRLFHAAKYSLICVILKESQKQLAISYLLYHNNYINNELRGKRTMKTKITYKGHEYDMDAARNLMDDDICEAIHGTVDTDQEFFDTYIKAHSEKFGEEFVIN